MSATGPHFANDLAAVATGRVPSRELAIELMRCGDAELPVLLQVSQDLRRQHKGQTISYSRKVFLPLTNLCRDYCGYCVFRRDPDQPGAHTMSPDEVLEVARRGEALGCTEALFSLGDKPEAIFPEMQATLRRLGYRSTLHYLEGMCEMVLRETRLIPHANPGLLSHEWLHRLREVSPSLGLMLESTNSNLTAHSIDAPDKLPSKRLAVIEDAGRIGIPFTTGILIGIGESVEDRVDSLFAIRDLHFKYGHIQEVIIQNFRAKARIPMSRYPEPSMNDMLRTISVARLILKDVNIQAPPNLSSSDYPRLLQGGINDWGGISPLTPDFINPEAPWPHLRELEMRTQSAGYRLKQRLPVYPEFLTSAVSNSSRYARRLTELADSDGFAITAASSTLQNAHGAA